MWKIYVEAILTENDTWDCLSGKLQKPWNQADTVKWEDKNGEAKANISLAITPKELK